MKSALLFILLIIASFCIYAQELIVRKTTDFELTGVGDAKEWANTDWTQIPQRKGQKNYRTEVKMQYSETGIYLLFRCEDEQVTATLQEDFADLYREDVVEAFFWTDERFPLYFEYELSPLNKELAILVPNNQGDFMGWRPWKYQGERRTRHEAAILEDQDWMAEFFIPYQLLKPLSNVPPTSGSRWRINLYRIDYDEGMTTWSWKPTRKNFHDYESFGTAVFQ
ncbi:MAG: carbohydrate-binding family 9-like protein [Bacteroidota bacterium]